MLPSTDLSQVIDVIGVGQMDSASWSNITLALQSRACRKVGELESRTRGELLSILRSLELKKSPNSYLDVLFEVTKVTPANGTPVGNGGNMMGRCTKEPASVGFKMREYQPDVKAFEGIPRKGEKEHLEAGEWALLQDRLVLEAQANSSSQFS